MKLHECRKCGRNDSFQTGDLWDVPGGYVRCVCGLMLQLIGRSEEEAISAWNNEWCYNTSGKRQIVNAAETKSDSKEIGETMDEVYEATGGDVEQANDDFVRSGIREEIPPHLSPTPETGRTPMARVACEAQLSAAQEARPIGKEVVASVQVEGLHAWPLCPIEDVAFLRTQHRHVFHIEVRAEVSHEEREVEIIVLGRRVKAFLLARYGNRDYVCDFGSMSCESIALLLIEEFNLSMCSVLEDGENGAVLTCKRPSSRREVIHDTEGNAYTVTPYVDPRANERTQWLGIEVEGPLKGLYTWFIAEHLPSSMHDTVWKQREKVEQLFLCPSIIQNEEASQVEAFIHSCCNMIPNLRTTIALRPQHIATLTQWMVKECHIMVDIPLPNGVRLKESDTIKVELYPYRTYSKPLYQMLSTSPEDYDEDIAIK